MHWMTNQAYKTVIHVLYSFKAAKYWSFKAKSPIVTGVL